jgi:DNA-directed RNA polymerase specialized sigma54-like protein
MQLEQRIKKELEENPVLEEGPDDFEDKLSGAG